MDDSVERRCAAEVLEGFEAFFERFLAITERGRERFETRDWRGVQRDALERLELYPGIVARTVKRVRALLGATARDRALWARIRGAYASRLRAARNRELAETFYNSVVRRTLSIVGVDPQVEFVALESAVDLRREATDVYETFPVRGDTPAAVLAVLGSRGFRAPYLDSGGDATRVAQRLHAYLREILGDVRIDALEVARPLFFRNKGAYVVGRVRAGDQRLPWVLPLTSTEDGITVDAALMTSDEVSIVFSFARSHFHVGAQCPRELIAFLKSIMPLKPIPELYVSLGLDKHGKTEQYRSLQRHLRRTRDRFVVARGDEGMVMIVFTLPLFNIVFKVIRDSFPYPKTTTRQEVLDRYRLVFERDRVGRLVEAQEFEHLTFRRDQFDDDLLELLARHASRTVTVDGDDVVIRHLYTERKVTPLNLYVREAGRGAAGAAVIDYGRAIKDLAAANIFPGDFLLKNFGVTRHGRVVFYDYDELCLVTDCRFRELPPPRFEGQELEPEPWFSVRDDEIFPEEFARFLGLPAPLDEVFRRHHDDLFGVPFWRRMQSMHQAGEFPDVFPYSTERRLHAGGSEPDES